MPILSIMFSFKYNDNVADAQNVHKAFYLKAISKKNHLNWTAELLYIDSVNTPTNSV
jgi:hypothetical protein